VLEEEQVTDAGESFSFQLQVQVLRHIL